jgi:hypothetical protein
MCSFRGCTFAILTAKSKDDQAFVIIMEPPPPAAVRDKKERQDLGSVVVTKQWEVNKENEVKLHPPFQRVTQVYIMQSNWRIHKTRQGDTRPRHYYSPPTATPALTAIFDEESSILFLWDEGSAMRGNITDEIRWKLGRGLELPRPRVTSLNTMAATMTLLRDVGPQKILVPLW